METGWGQLRPSNHLAVLLWSSWQPHFLPVTEWMPGHKGVDCRLWVYQYSKTQKFRMHVIINIQVLLTEGVNFYANLSTYCNKQWLVLLCSIFFGVLNFLLLLLLFCISDEPAVSIYSWTAEDPGTLLWKWDDQSEQGLLSADSPVCSGGQTGLQRCAGKILFMFRCAESLLPLQCWSYYYPKFTNSTL